MWHRHDSMNMYEDYVDCGPWDAYIASKAEEGTAITYMDLMIASLVRVIAQRPKLNRFIMNGRVYARPKIWVSFVVHRSLKGDDAETTIKLCFDGTETVYEVADIIHNAINRETYESKGPNATDSLAKILTSIPGPIIYILVGIIKWLDRHNMLPKAILEASPFHTSLFITNLKSLGINHIYHHVYNFGTTGLFIAIGKEKRIPAVYDNQVVVRKVMEYGLVSDERFCDGLYFARSLRKLRHYLKDPSLLETPLAARVEDQP